MAMTASVGPPDEPVVSFLAAVDNVEQLDAAKDLWKGELEVVQHVIEPYGSSHLATIPRPRLGGPWLALLAAGYKVRINDAEQADAVLSTARAAQMA